MASKYINALRGYARLGNFPLDASSIFEDKTVADTYAASDPSAYAGQIVSIVDELNTTVDVYILTFDESGSGNFMLDSIDMNQDFLDEFNAFYELFTVTQDKISINTGKSLEVDMVSITGTPSNNTDVISVEHFENRITQVTSEIDSGVQIVSFPINGLGGAYLFSEDIILSEISIRVTSSYNYPLQVKYDNVVIIPDSDIVEEIPSGPSYVDTILDINQEYSAALLEVRPTTNGVGAATVTLKYFKI